MGQWLRGSHGVLVLGGLLLLWLVSGLYIVGPGERGVVLLFGKLWSQTEPGLRYHLPWPIQTRRVVDTARVRRAEIGFRTSEGRSAPVPEESLMLTGDENIVFVGSRATRRSSPKGRRSFFRPTPISSATSTDLARSRQTHHAHLPRP